MPLVNIRNDISTSHNVFLDIQNYIRDLWTGFSFWISEMKIMTSNNWIIDFPSKKPTADIQNVHSGYIKDATVDIWNWKPIDDKSDIISPKKNVIVNIWNVLIN